jgi:hypothetical protein
MTEKDSLKDIHRRCLNLERDESGEPTGNVCRKSRGHDDKKKVTDPRRRAHFDPDHGGVIWGLDMETAES